MVRRIIVQVCAVICPFKENMVRVANILDVHIFSSPHYVADSSIGPLPSVRKGACMMHYHLAHLATPLTTRTYGEEKRDNKINSYYLNNAK